MEYQQYISGKKELFDNFHHFLDDESSSEEEFQSLISYLKSNKFEEKSEELKLILCTINDISNNYHRYPGFNSKIEQVLLFFSDSITQKFKNSEIFQIFKKNKRILHFLMQNKIITVDKEIADLILKVDSSNKKERKFTSYFIENREQADKYFDKKRESRNYVYYFFPEIKAFLDEKKRKSIEEELFKRYGEDENEFELNRQKGENESHVYELIRQDSIKDFIIYVNKNNLALSSEIKESIFETNPFLIENQATTLIEYAAFFGSIQIFQYLKLNNVELKPSLWLYAIHGKNPNIIHIIEEMKIMPDDETFVECLKESIKCHHNDIALYIMNNLMDQKIEIDKKNFKSNAVSFGFHYHNYEFIHGFDNIQFVLYYACLYDYLPIVKLLLSKGEIDLNQKIIQL